MSDNINDFVLVHGKTEQGVIQADEINLLDIRDFSAANLANLRKLIMSRSAIILSMLVSSGWLFSNGHSAAEPMTRQPSAMEKMMPSDQVPKMRACEKRAMDAKIEMAERTAFIKKCMSE
jgi:hypothetical protein